jgi:hypothetical protein
LIKLCVIRLIAKYKKEISENSNGDDETISRVSKELYELVFKPLVKNLNEKKEIFISPEASGS